MAPSAIIEASRRLARLLIFVFRRTRIPSASSARCSALAMSGSSRGRIFPALNNRNLTAESREHLAKLQTDVAAADHDQGFRQDCAPLHCIVVLEYLREWNLRK